MTKRVKRESERGNKSFVEYLGETQSKTMSLKMSAMLLLVCWHACNAAKYAFYYTSWRFFYVVGCTWYSDYAREERKVCMDENVRHV